MKNISMRSDLAVEIQELYKVSEQEGFSEEEYTSNGIEVTRIRIFGKKVSEQLGKPIGSYVTVDLSESFSDEETHKNAVEVTSGEISRLLYGDPEKKEKLQSAEEPNILVVGLGNRHMTSDALGPDAVDRILVTRHIRNNMPDLYEKLGLNLVSALNPGVLGQTGIEAFEIVKSVCETVNPAAVVVIDALASRKMNRLCRTIQLTDTGIAPGSGVGNHRAELSKATLGVPVISIGIPMVVDAVTLTTDTIELALEKIKKELSSDRESSEIVNAFSAFEEYDGEDIIRSALSPYDMNLVVTPKDIDRLTEKCAGVLSLALNKALHGGLEEEEISALLGL